eukprot:161525-Rhodomonas_salina.1
MSMPPGRASYSFTPATDSTSMPPGRASYSFTPATYSTSMPPGRASYSFPPVTDSTSMPLLCHFCHRHYVQHSGSGPGELQRHSCYDSGSGELQRHSCSDELQQHSCYDSTSFTMSTFQLGQGHRVKPLARASNTRCYSHKGAHESSMMIVEHHGQPGKSHEHLQRMRTQRTLTP